MRERLGIIKHFVESGWWAFLVTAIVLLGAAAVATAIEAQPISRLAGSLAWAAAFVGCVGALAVGVGRKADH